MGAGVGVVNGRIVEWGVECGVSGVGGGRCGLAEFVYVAKSLHGDFFPNWVHFQVREGFVTERIWSKNREASASLDPDPSDERMVQLHKVFEPTHRRTCEQRNRTRRTSWHTCGK